MEFVKIVPDFIAKMGLSKADLKEHHERNQEAKLEDKFPKQQKDQVDEEEKYDFENAQIEDLASILEGGDLASEVRQSNLD